VEITIRIYLGEKMERFKKFYNKYSKFYSKRPKKELVDLIATSETMIAMDMSRRKK
tara:strand:- start:138 stop:305 length:168 start_codon:yes stop_codon:yes gene_type:complete